MNFNITPTTESKLKHLDLSKLQAADFGKYFSDHMLIARYKDGQWDTPHIEPYTSLSFAPSLSALHYGQAVFEGMKAHKLINGKVGIFRMEPHFERFNRSAERLCMPQVPKEIFCEGLKKLIHIDQDWVSNNPGSALYIRPFLFASDEQIMASQSKTYQFMIITAPVSPYFSKNLNIFVEDHFSRAATGGVGYAKAAGNYAGGFAPTQQAQKKGFDQILWLDAETHSYVQECGVMNIMFLINDTFITPDLNTHTILAGITRDSAIQLLKSEGKKVAERKIPMQEIITASQNGSLKEAFGIGTAVTAAFIESFTYKGNVLSVQNKDFPEGKKIKQWIEDARYGKNHNPITKEWLTIV